MRRASPIGKRSSPFAARSGRPARWFGEPPPRAAAAPRPPSARNPRVPRQDAAFPICAAGSVARCSRSSPRVRSVCSRTARSPCATWASTAPRPNVTGRARASRSFRRATRAIRTCRSIQNAVSAATAASTTASATARRISADRAARRPPSAFPSPARGRAPGARVRKRSRPRPILCARGAS